MTVRERNTKLLKNFLTGIAAGAGAIYVLDYPTLTAVAFVIPSYLVIFTLYSIIDIVFDKVLGPDDREESLREDLNEHSMYRPSDQYFDYN